MFHTSLYQSGDRVFVGLTNIDTGVLAVFECFPGGDYRPFKILNAAGKIHGAPSCYVMPDEIRDEITAAILGTATISLLVDMPITADEYGDPVA